MENDKQKKTIKILVSIIIILVLLFAGYFGNKQLQQKYDDKIMEGAKELIKQMVIQLTAEGYVQLPYENQTLVLVPYQGEK